MNIYSHKLKQKTKTPEGLRPRPQPQLQPQRQSTGPPSRQEHDCETMPTVVSRCFDISNILDCIHSGCPSLNSTHDFLLQFVTVNSGWGKVRIMTPCQPSCLPALLASEELREDCRFIVTLNHRVDSKPKHQRRDMIYTRQKDVGPCQL